MRFNMLVPVSYQALAEHLLQRAADPNDPLDLSFEGVRKYLEESVTAMMTDPDNRGEEIEDLEVTDILMTDHFFGTINEVVVTTVPGCVVRVGDHLLKLPLVLIKI